MERLSADQGRTRLAREGSGEAKGSSTGSAPPSAPSHLFFRRGHRLPPGQVTLSDAKRSGADKSAMRVSVSARGFVALDLVERHESL